MKSLPALLLEAEEKFDERFLDGGLMADDGDYGYMSVYKDVQEFFRKQILSILSEAEKATEVGKLKPDADATPDYQGGYNNAIYDILSQVKSLWREWRGNI